MAYEHKNDDGVIIHEPDRALQTKIGVKNLDQLLSADIIKSAEKVIHDSSDEFHAECMTQLAKLEQLLSSIKSHPQPPASSLQAIIDEAFSIKAQAALGGYQLVSAVAKSLHLLVEQFVSKPFTSKCFDIIQFHIVTIKQLLAARMKGDGGPAGTAIMTELERLVQKNQA